MKCRKCGADLLDTDTFCVKCGQKVDQPMFCSSCGEQLRDGERFCHKCGSPVKAAVEDDEIPLSKQQTVDIPFDEIEQGILMEAEQAIVKRPGAQKPERRNPESYRRPRAEISENNRSSSKRETEFYRPGSVRDEEYYEDPDDEDDERYKMPVRQKRRTPPLRPRYEEDYDDYDEDDDSDGSKMKVITVILGIVVVAVALAIGFVLWQRNDTFRYERPEEETEQGIVEDGEEGGEPENEISADTQGRIQILSNVNVRNKPTTEGSEVIMVAKTGETYEYYELIDGAWYHIKLDDGGDGYVSEKYVEDLK